MEPITQVASRLGIKEEHLIPYGRYKAKVSLDALKDSPNPATQGKLVVVTGITPTPAGEGKTTTAIGLTQAMGRLGHRVTVNLREPSLGPIYGIKGGGTGGGKARVFPEDEINIHFTGDAHAVSSAHNLLAALVDNAVYRGAASGMDATGIQWSRVTDASDRALRYLVAGFGANGPFRETRFDFVAASEIMAILALSADLEDLRARLNRIVVGTSRDGEPVTVEDLGVAGSLLTVLRHAIIPNLVQTLEGQPAFVHTGPFGNIAHGCNSIVADRLALGFADYVVTEAGFASDLGFEKFMHIKARQSGLLPNAVVLVATVRALRWHGGAGRRELAQPNLEATVSGCANLAHHVKIVRDFGLPVVVAINRYDDDGPDELRAVENIARDAGATDVAEISGFTHGGEGGLALAEAVVRVIWDNADADGRQVQYAYDLDASVQDKVRALARRTYNADDVSWTAEARRKLRYFESQGWGSLPICMAKTHLSISHDPTRRGSPSGYVFPISDIRASVGAGFLYTLAGQIETLPGLPTRPRALDMDVTPSGEIIGLS